MRGAVISDLHTGHPQVPAVNLREALIRWCYPRLKGIEILFISGDFFDVLLDLNSKAGYCAGMIINDLKQLAYSEHFYIRVLRGTFKHDRHQNHFFLTDQDPGLNGSPLVSVIDTPSVEYISSLNINILYLPDEMPGDIYDTIENLASVNHIDKFDFIINHGYFEHLLPRGIPSMPKNTLNQQRINKYVKGCVFNGHVHSTSVYHNVVNVGSFERLCHGEEESKGFYLFDYDYHKVKLEFVENKSATWFKTFKYNEKTTLDGFITWITQQGLDPERAYHLRLYGENLNIKAELESYVRQVYPFVLVSICDLSTVKQNVSTTTFVMEELPPVTEANLAETIYEHIEHKLTVEQIKEVLNG